MRTPVLVEHRREALVRAAIEVFSTKGYHSAKVSEIAEAAGMSQGTVYNYVRSKEDILFLVCTENLDGYERIVRGAAEAAEPGLPRLRAILHATVQAVFLYQNHHLVKVRELHHIDGARRRQFFAAAAKSRAVCEDLLKQAASEAGIALPNSLLTANLLIFLPNLILSRGWDFRKAVTEEEVADFLVEFMWRGLGLTDTGERAPEQAPRPTRRAATA